MSQELISNQNEPEKVLLVVIELKNEETLWTLPEEIAEMTELVAASGGKVVESVQCRLSKISAGNYIGDGKLQEIAGLVALHHIDTVIFNHDLKGSQQRKLEEVIKTKTIDRTQLILDIFARRATTNEGKMQVELAQLEYLLPRLTGKGIELSRLGGGIGTLGPGETKLEVDRRRISDRIARLKNTLKDVAQNRALTRKKRKDQGVPAISLVGYTNAGKSTLLNALTDAKQVTKDGLFTTLDSLSRKLTLPNHQKVVISDTVGFMHDLPHHLIESFHATLEVVTEADLLLHVIDVSNPNFRHLYQSVMDVLLSLNVLDKPMIVVLNKIDQIDHERAWLEQIVESYGNAVAISAKDKNNLDELYVKITEKLSSLIIEINVNVPIHRMDLVNLAHEEGEVVSVKYYNKKINIRAFVPRHIAGKFEV
ncbi:MAG: GTPase HflX [Candidatus Omnitrophica bacterium]|nr:GTPase HflX [Candidatus Omnitrophota bacterium]